jgi:glutathione S-transferase
VWLDANIALDAPMTYADIALICMWDHVQHYKTVADLTRYPRIAARVEKLAARPAVASTTPDASLATARAAGWNPG